MWNAKEDSRAHGGLVSMWKRHDYLCDLLNCNALVTVVCVGSSFLPVLAKVEEKTKTCPLLYTSRDRHRYHAGTAALGDSILPRAAQMEHGFSR